MKASEKRTEFVEVIKFVNSLHACWLGTVAIQQIQFKILLIAFKSQIGLKPLDPFGTGKQKKVHRFTNSLQGLQKVMVKDFS